MIATVTSQEVREAVSEYLEKRGFKVVPNDLKMKPEYDGSYGNDREVIGVEFEFSIPEKSKR